MNDDAKGKEEEKETLLPVFHKPTQSSTPPVIGMHYRMGACVAFVTLGISIKLFQHGVRDLHYNFLCPIVVITLVKLTLSLGLYAGYDGPLQEIPRKLRIARAMVFRYAVVAALYCLYDVLSFVNLANFDPQTYLVFLNLRTPLTGVVWERVFGKPLSWCQRGALLLIVGGCVMKQSGGNLTLTSTSSSPTTAVLLLFVQVIANVLAGVANETLLKEKCDVSFNLQNAIQYTWVVVWCLLVGLIAPVEGIALNPFDTAEWAKVLHPRMIPNIVVLSMLGLITSFLLKYLDSVWKAICTSVELFMTAFASAAVFGYAVGVIDFIALGVASFGIYIYSAPWAKYTLPESPHSTQRESVTTAARPQTTGVRSETTGELTTTIGMKGATPKAAHRRLQ